MDNMISISHWGMFRVVPSAADDELIEKVARIISPMWFEVENGRCVLDNYPQQHKRYQDAARQQARHIIEVING